MAKNPNPLIITDPMWKLWEGCPVPGVKLSGIYANKAGYHNTVNANLHYYPSNYSVKLPLDLVPENRTRARAIDLTMSDTEMVKWTTRMKTSFENPLDTRLDAVKEFYGTLDNKTVFGLSKDKLRGPVRRVSADKTHLWHGHTSIFTHFVNNWPALAPLLSVWAGVPFSEWSVGGMPLPKQGDTGEEVKYWQQMHNEVRSTVNPASPAIIVDGDYGTSSAAAFADFYHKHLGSATYKGELITGWLAVAYQKAFVKLNGTVLSPAVDPLVVKSLVNAWLEANLGSEDSLQITGSLTAKIALP